VHLIGLSHVCILQRQLTRIEYPTVNLNAFCNSYAKTANDGLSWSSLSFTGVAASKMRASSSPRVSTFLLYTSLLVQPQKPKFKGVRPGDSNTSLGYHSELYVRSHNFLFLTMTDNITSQNTDLSSWITLYKNDDLIRSKHVALLYTRLTVFITT